MEELPQWATFQVNLDKFREDRKARQDQKRAAGPQQDGQYGRSMTTAANWENLGFPSMKVHDQIQAIADGGNTPEARLTLLASLKESLDGYELEDKQDNRHKPPEAKRTRKGK